MSMIQTGKLELSSNQPIETRGGNTSTFTRVNFPSPFPAGSSVVVHAQTQTFNGPETPGIRIHDFTPQGFLSWLYSRVVPSVVHGFGRHPDSRSGDVHEF
ncbi:MULTISPECIES: hypothetical protein [Streptomyces]|uniref:hypothetical protein n=1 Tax=Streptomyces TaxID=1883 RepID=UPI0021A6C5E7|nr:hypothetical protein [Streptomyces atratus]MCT2543283.1 hypothetical protein [Streptomyces atratus]